MTITNSPFTNLEVPELDDARERMIIMDKVDGCKACDLPLFQCVNTILQALDACMDEKNKDCYWDAIVMLMQLGDSACDNTNTLTTRKVQ